MRTTSLNLSALALTTMLSGSLILGACGDKNKTKSGSTSVKMQKVETRKVSEADATKALTAMNLQNSGSGVFAWADRDGAAGTYTYKNLTITGDDGKTTSADSLELMGVRMEGDLVAFDKIALNGFSGKGDDGEVIAFKGIELIKPTPALSNAFAQALSGNEKAFDNMTGDVGIGGFGLTGFSVTDDDAVVNMDTLKFSEGKDKKGMFALKDLSVKASGDEKVDLKLGSITADGINIEKYKPIFAAGFAAGKNGEEMGEDAIAKMMSSMNVYDPDYDNFSMNNLTADIDGLKINMDRLSGKTVRKGDKIMITQSMSPLTIRPPADASGDMAEFKEALDTMGYEELEFTFAQTSEMNEKTDSAVVKDSYIQMKDGFKLSMDYDFTGYKAMMEKMTAMQVGGGDTDPMAAMGMLSEMKFNNLRLALKDDSIIDRGFKMAAKQQGGSADALKAQAKAGLAFLPMMAQDPGQQKVAGDLSKALGALLEKGGTIVIAANPDKPIDLGAVMQGTMTQSFDISTLGLEISHQ